MTRPASRAVVYWRAGCPFCLVLKVKLRLSRTPHTLVDIRADAAAAALVRQHNGGDELVPTVQVGDMFLSNPSLGAVRAALAA